MKPSPEAKHGVRKRDRLSQKSRSVAIRSATTQTIMQGEVCYQVKRHGLWHLQCYMKDTLRAFEQAERERLNRICPECKKGYLAPHISYHYETREVSYPQMNGTETTVDVQNLERDGNYVSCGNCKHKFDLEEDRDWAWEVT